MNTYELYKDRLDNIWANPNYQNLLELRIPPLCAKTTKHDAVLIVGLNPSIAKADEERFVEEYKQKSLSDWNDCYEDDNHEHRYFRRFDDLVEGTGYKFTHIDLLYFRKTSSKSAKWMWGNQRSFIIEQIEISVEIINKVSPKAIIVNNAFACDMLREYEEQTQNYNISDFDKKIGTYWYNETIPIFFSGMIEGTAPMDKGTFERLNWHLKYVLGKL